MSDVTYLSLPGYTLMVPSLGFAGLNLSITPGLFPSFRVKLGTGMNSPSSFSFESAVYGARKNKNEQNKFQFNANGYMTGQRQSGTQ